MQRPVSGFAGEGTVRDLRWLRRRASAVSKPRGEPVRRRRTSPGRFSRSPCGQGHSRPRVVGARCLSSAMTTTAELRPEAPAGVLVAAKARRRAADAAEADLLQLAVGWAVMHPAESIDEAATHTLRGFGDRPPAGFRVLRASPSSVWPSSRRWSVCPPRPASATSARPSSCASGCRGCGGASPPVTWRPGRAASWPARRSGSRPRPPGSSTATSRRSPTGCAPPARPAGRRGDRPVHARRGRGLAAQAAERRHVTVHDQQVSFSGTTYVEAELDLADALDFEAAVAAGAEQRAALESHEPLDVRRAQAVGDLSRRQLALDLATPTGMPAVKARRVVLHVHLSEAVLHGADRTGRLEQGRSLVTVDQIRDWCGNPDAEVVVKPVLDLDGCVSVDSYEVPDRICEQVALRDATCVFPWCTRPARRCDCDHTVAHRERRDLLMQPGRPVSSPPSAQDSLALELRRARPRSLPLDQPPRLPVPPRPPRHHRPLATGHVRPARPTPDRSAPWPVAEAWPQSACWVTFMIAPFGSRTKKRRKPHSSSVIG